MNEKLNESACQPHTVYSDVVPSSVGKKKTVNSTSDEAFLAELELMNMTTTPICKQQCDHCNAEVKNLSSPKQFNFARHWKKKISTLLDVHAVVEVLTLGLKLYDLAYEEGDPPWMCGNGELNGQRAKAGCLSWYQPWGRCHYIAPFCWALGCKLYPELKWGFISSDAHTVVIGWHDDWKKPKWVMDILLFREKTAAESLAFAKGHGWKVYRSLTWYWASFAMDPENAVALLSDGCGELEMACRPPVTTADPG